jgi:hypothetical protein
VTYSSAPALSASTLSFAVLRTVSMITANSKPRACSGPAGPSRKSRRAASPALLLRIGNHPLRSRMQLGLFTSHDGIADHRPQPVCDLRSNWPPSATSDKRHTELPAWFCIFLGRIKSRVEQWFASESNIQRCGTRRSLISWRCRCSLPRTFSRSALLSSCRSSWRAK